jgi:hypothetical protein
MRPILQIKILQKYAQITVDLWSLSPEYDLNEQESFAFHKLIQNYIANHWFAPHIRRQYYIVSPDYVTFLCSRFDIPYLKAEIERILSQKIDLNVLKHQRNGRTLLWMKS